MSKLDKLNADENKVKLSTLNNGISDEIKKAEAKLKTDVNLLEKKPEKKAVKKTCLSLYLDEDDLNLLKAIAYEKKVSVNKFILDVLVKEPLDSTRKYLPEDFDVNKLSKKYDNQRRPKSKK